MTSSLATDFAPVTAAPGCPHHAPVAAHRPLPGDTMERALATTHREGDGRTAVLLVNHGSRSTVWRRMLLDMHAHVAQDLLTIPTVTQVRTAFMEYTEPSIATQLREIDATGIDSVLVVPLLLTISDHSFDDIPTICGQADPPGRVAQLAAENIEVHRPDARVEFSPLLDFSGLVRVNLNRRIQAALSPFRGTGERVGLVLVGYGSAEYDDEWNRFFLQTRSHAEADLGIAASTHAWCGHLVDYKREPTVNAINEMLGRTDRVVVVPQLVAYDPMFQERIIGRAVTQCADPGRVLYTADAILPEPEVARWVTRIAREMLCGSADTPR